MPDKGGHDEPEHVKLVGDELSIGEERLGKALVGVAQVEGHEAHVLASGDMVKGDSQVVTALAVHYLHQAMVRAIYYHANKLSPVQGLVPAKEVLVDSNFSMTLAEPSASAKFEMLVDDALNQTGRVRIRVRTILRSTNSSAASHTACR